MAGECAERQCQPRTNATKKACGQWGDEGEKDVVSNRAEGQGHRDPGLPEKVARHSTCLAPRHLLVVIVRHVENLCGSHSGRQDQGMTTLTLSASVPYLQSPQCIGSFCQQPSFVGLYMIALGAGGIRPCVSYFGADQFDDTEPVQEKRGLTS